MATSRHTATTEGTSKARPRRTDAKRVESRQLGPTWSIDIEPVDARPVETRPVELRTIAIRSVELGSAFSGSAKHQPAHTSDLDPGPSHTPVNDLLDQVRACRLCADHLPLGPRPVLVASDKARLLIAGQAPGTKVHASGIPWDDVSGVRLRRWLGLAPAEFYDPAHVAIVPMGFCYPGRGKSGDMPPRPECRAHWHDRLFAELPDIRLKIVIGQYALAYHLSGQLKSGASLTEVVADWRSRLPGLFVLPHPSPRNELWLRRNPWFEAEVVPVLQAAVREQMPGA